MVLSRAWNFPHEAKTMNSVKTSAKDFVLLGFGSWDTLWPWWPLPRYFHCTGWMER